jgi:hypothetical protein
MRSLTYSPPAADELTAQDTSFLINTAGSEKGGDVRLILPPFWLYPYRPDPAADVRSCRRASAFAMVQVASAATLCAYEAGESRCLPRHSSRSFS